MPFTLPIISLTFENNTIIFDPTIKSNVTACGLRNSQINGKPLQPCIDRQEEGGGEINK